jgi:ABC-2 type transport system permease protein
MSTPAMTTTRAMPESNRLDRLLAPGEPPRRAGALAASAVFGWRAMLKIKREPKQLTDSIAIPILFTVLFTYLFGGAIGGTPGNYLKTLLPGTLVISITIVTMYGGARLAQDLTTGVFDRFRSLSIWRGALVLGGLFGAAVGPVTDDDAEDHHDGGAPGVIAAMALVIAFGLSMSWLWAAIALLVRNPATVTSIGAAVLIPPTFASNIFVKTSTMPGWLQAFVKVNPVSHLTAAARDLMNSTGGGAGPVVWSLIATAAITVVFAPLALTRTGRRLTVLLHSPQGPGDDRTVPAARDLVTKVDPGQPPVRRQVVTADGVAEQPVEPEVPQVAALVLAHIGHVVPRHPVPLSHPVQHSEADSLDVDGPHDAVHPDPRVPHPEQDLGAVVLAGMRVSLVEPDVVVGYAVSIDDDAGAGQRHAVVLLLDRVLEARAARSGA